MARTKHHSVTLSDSSNSEQFVRSATVAQTRAVIKNGLAVDKSDFSVPQRVSQIVHQILVNICIYVFFLTLWFVHNRSTNLKKGLEQNWTSDTRIFTVIIQISWHFSRKLVKDGINGITLELMRWYLLHRKQRVIVNGVRSDNKSIISGVPQDTFIGLLKLNFIF